MSSAVNCPQNESPPPKRFCYEYPELSVDSEDSLPELSDDSITSYQGYATASVWESGEDWSPSSSSDAEAGGDFYTVEYELATDTSNNEFTLSESDESLSCANVIIPIPTITIEMGYSSTSGDEEVVEEAILRNSPVMAPKTHERDRWRCIRCNLLNEWPWRYCLKCYRVRKGWLPDRPKNHKRSRKRGAADAGSQKKSSGSEKECDSGVNSQESGPSSLVLASENEPSGSQTASHTENSQNDTETSEVCERCSSHPADGLFVHGRTAHQFYCYECCKLAWKEDRHCPICKRTVQKVVKVFRSVF